MATTEKKAPSSQRAKSRREEQIQQQKRNQQILLTVLAVALLVGVVAAIFIATRPPEAIIPEEVKTRFTAFGADMQGFTSEGFPYLGKADAPSTIEEFGSFSCPHCAEYDDGTFNKIIDEIQAGRVKYVFVPLPSYGGWNSQPATEAAICMGQQNKFWEMGDTLFSWQNVYGPTSNDPARLSITAQQFGLNMDKYNACLSSDTPKQVIEKAAELSTQRGVNVTPTIFFNGQQLSPAPNSGPNPTLSEMRGLIEAAANQKKS